MTDECRGKKKDIVLLRGSSGEEVMTPSSLKTTPLCLLPQLLRCRLNELTAKPIEQVNF
jgi:hypothetical protein